MHIYIYIHVNMYIYIIYVLLNIRQLKLKKTSSYWLTHFLSDNTILLLYVKNTKES